MAGALEGVRILEFSEILAAPFGGMMLSDLGADIIKVEPLEGESWRHQGAGFAPGESRSFVSLNRGKRGLAVDLKRDEGRRVIYDLVPSADVVIVNYRPDTPARLGIDYETLSALNPRLVYVHNTAFGTTGSDRLRPGYDIVAQAMTGLMAAEGKTDVTGNLVPINPAVADMSTGYVIAWATCAGLFSRERTGRGQRIDTSLLATSMGLLTGSVLRMPDTPDPTGIGEVPARLAAARAAGASFEELANIRSAAFARGWGANPYYRCYTTADSVIAVGALNDVLRSRLAACVGVSDPRLTDPTLPRIGPEATAIAAEVTAAMTAALLQRTTAEWLAEFDRAGVPAGPVRFPEELADDPDIVANGLVVDLDHPIAGLVRMVGPVVRMSDTPPAASRPSPIVGQHTAEILAEAGYPPERVAALEAAGVVRTARPPAPDPRSAASAPAG